MMKRRRSAFPVLSLLLCGLLAAACDKSTAKAGGGGGDTLYAQSDSPDNLKGLLETVVKAGESGDTKKAAALTRALLPDEAALKKAVKDDAPAEFSQKVLEFARSVPADDAQVAGLFKRGDAARTEVQVHGATGAEIAEYKQGSVPFKEFPGGAQKLAQSVLRPDTRFYEVEFVKPGEDAGMKYHLFYWDGATWRMLGPAWRWAK
jgi:hypothetical protein